MVDLALNSLSILAVYYTPIYCALIFNHSFVNAFFIIVVVVLSLPCMSRDPGIVSFVLLFDPELKVLVGRVYTDIQHGVCIENFGRYV